MKGISIVIEVVSMRFFLMCFLLRIGSIFSQKMFIAKAQKIIMASTNDLSFSILDLGGGGEGVIGQLYGNHVTAIDLHQEELNEAPDGPIKVVGDARNLPFEDASFASATAFYFFMYTKTEDHLRIFQEAYRILRPDGKFIIWDTEIEPQGNRRKSLFIVPVQVKLPDHTISTAYGTTWKDRVQTQEMFIRIGAEAGFEVINRNQAGKAFYLSFRKK